MTQESQAAQETMAMITAAGRDGIRIHEIARARKVTEGAAFNVLRRLRDSGQIVTFRHSYKDSRYYIRGMQPKDVTDWQMVRLTSIRDANKTMPAGEPIITPKTKVTVAPPFVDRRFAFEPPSGWRGQITRDWLDRRLEAQR